MNIEFDYYSVVEIDLMIAQGICTEAQVVAYYGNEWWRDAPNDGE